VKIFYDPNHGCLILDTALVNKLFYPPELKAVARADGLLLGTDHDIPGAVSLELLNPDYGNECEDDAEEGEPGETIANYHAPISAETATALRLRPGPYLVWIERSTGEAYAIPEETAVRSDGDAVTVGLAVHPQDIQALETLGLQHGVRARDIIAAFVADLAANTYSSLPEKLARSGGSDERERARSWFERNAAPPDEPGEYPAFMPGPSYEP